MFCYQCQEAAKGQGCSIKGVCGKTDDVSNMQDLLVYVSKGVSYLADFANSKEINTVNADHFVMDSMFMTITNANFDQEAIEKKIKHGLTLKEDLIRKISNEGLNFDMLPDCVT